MTRCTVCNAPHASDCATCHSIAYCSDKCRSEDAAVHNLICQEFANLSNGNPKPEKSAFLAIMLLPDATTPKLVWLKGDKMYELEITKAGKDALTTTSRYYLGGGKGGGKPTPDRQRIKTKFDLDHTIAHRWSGEIVIVGLVGMNQVNQDFEEYQDVTAADLHVASHNFKSFGDGVGVTETLNLHGHVVDHRKFETASMMALLTDIYTGKVGKTVKGVKVFCDYDEKVLRKGKYAEIVMDYAHHHEIFNLKAASITAMMKMPLIMYRYPDGSQARVRSLKLAPLPSQNMEAWLLNLDFDVDSSSWGKTKEVIWTKEKIGNVWVARDDRRDITVQQVEAIVSFCCVHLYAVLVSDEILRDEKLSAEDLSKQRKKLLEEHVCKEKFEIFFKQMKAEKVRKGNRAWKDAVSPYSVS
ncbi:uncharacterized protein PAC_13911 [Phialocephala subalpina]|uniref:MYND-type domain-containing protein n=1 Tax=Phialocephala subalpina TaxID=576137 RepID=A0A1L7XG66_9HELO|nr:uncharacterized protein PAC_13911 [Phialocephala subalpina]